MIISRELLSEVYFDNIKPNITTIEEYNNNCIRIFWVSTYDESIEIDVIINIYELAHKCKEWAWNNSYGIEELAFSVKVYELTDGSISNTLKTSIKLNHIISILSSKLVSGY